MLGGRVMTERCNNFPCQLSARHPGLCSSTGDGECFSDQERHARIQSLIAAEDEGAYLVRLGNPEILLQKIDEYLTERCDLAYLNFYRESKMVQDSNGKRDNYLVPLLVNAWTELGDAREIVRRPLREMQQAKLKGRRVIDGGILR